ncbi:6104_t:CDS:2 [Dentiscutata erythropus]|uniref:6104_t:CDS:1 n=1 Tax=Dentiscutata erythropus TaxID=1348616 RepID=A0A9N8W0N3_9GLOM|nr:6104_t:CDS:2 [Dentiscutata erythropus]
MNRQLNLSSNYEKEIETSKEKVADNSDRQNVSGDSTRQNESGDSTRQNDNFHNQQGIGTDKNKKKTFRQTFFLTPKYNKNSIYSSPTRNGTPNRAQVCCEATQEWNKIKTKSMEEINNIIKAYLTTLFNLYNIQTMKLRNFVSEENLAPFYFTIYSVEDPVPEIPPNVVAQKNAANAIEIAKKIF